MQKGITGGCVGKPAPRVGIGLLRALAEWMLCRTAQSRSVGVMGWGVKAPNCRVALLPFSWPRDSCRVLELTVLGFGSMSSGVACGQRPLLLLLAQSAQCK